MKKRTIVLLIAICLTLTACNGLSQDKSATGHPDLSTSPATVAELPQDILTYAAGVSGDECMLTINGEDIPADLFHFELYNSCSNFLYNYSILGYTVKDFADYLREETINYLLYCTIIRQNAEKYGYSLTSDQLDEIRANLLSEGQQYYDETKAYYGLSDASMEFIASIGYYYDNLMTIIPEPTLDELNNHFYKAKHILLTTVTSVPDENGESVDIALEGEIVAEKLALAEDILAQLQAVEGDAQLLLFDELMEKYSEDGRDANGNIYISDGYLTSRGQMVKGFEEGALALDYNEISGIVESSYGYHIILRLEIEDMVSNFGEYALQYRQYQMSQMIAEWGQGTMPVRSAALDNLNVASFYDRYTAYQAEMGMPSNDDMKE